MNKLLHVLGTMCLLLLSGCNRTLEYDYATVCLVDYAATEIRDRFPQNKFKVAIRSEWQQLENGSLHHFMAVNVSHKDYESMYAYAGCQQKQSPFLTIYFFSVAEAAIKVGSKRKITNEERPFLVAEYEAKPSPVLFRQFPKGFKNEKKQHAYGVNDFPQ